MFCLFTPSEHAWPPADAEVRLWRPVAQHRSFYVTRGRRWASLCESAAGGLFKYGSAASAARLQFGAFADLHPGAKWLLSSSREWRFLKVCSIFSLTGCKQLLNVKTAECYRRR